MQREMERAERESLADGAELQKQSAIISIISVKWFLADGADLRRNILLNEIISCRFLRKEYTLCFFFIKFVQID